MNRKFTFAVSLLFAVSLMTQGWPGQYKGVMLQAFYWDSYADTQWSNLESQADELAEFFNLVWIPQSGKSASDPSMGYNDLYWFSDYTSSFGNEEQLRSMLNTFRQKGLGAIADVVINHRSSLAGTWMSFPEETYKGVTYTMLPSDICSNDDGGKAAAQAEVKPTGAADTGDDFDGARDLDHTSPNVQAMVKAYLDFLLNDLGYTGFRYDMVKGYAPKYTAMYNAAAKPEFSVGEYWDGTSQIKNWLDGTKDADGQIQSAAFDFPLKYLLNDCCNKSNNWNKLTGSSLMADVSGMRRYAVTFVDNHDTYRDQNALTNNVLAANAFILAAPGTPCIFLPHWKEHKQAVKQMIYARRAAGISNESTYKAVNNSAAQYAIQVSGDAGKSVIVMMGGTTWDKVNAKEADYFLVEKGDNYAYYISRNAETAWAGVPSGTYYQAFSVTLNAVTQQSGAQLVYTTDGSEPTASSKKIDDGGTVSVSGDMILKVGLLVGGTVKGVITRNYKVTHFQPYDITVYVNVDQVGWNNVYYHTWGGDNDQYSTTWPGKLVTATKEIGGKTWYYNTYRISSSTDVVNFVFGSGDNMPQTVDVLNVKTDKFYEVSTAQSGGKHLVNDVTAQYPTGIKSVTAGTPSQPGNMNVYTIDGRLVRQFRQGTTVDEAVNGLAYGLYIVGGKKVVVR